MDPTFFVGLFLFNVGCVILVVDGAERGWL